MAAEAEQAQAGGSMVKVVLDFIARCLYPGIIIALLVILYPTISQIDIPDLVKRLKSASIAGNQLTFGLAEQVGSESAELNNKVAALQGELDIMRADMERMRAALNEQNLADLQISEAEQAERAERKSLFDRYSGYSVLVFHRNDPGAWETAGVVSEKLIAAGFKASSTPTDFTELRRQHPPGTIYVTHTAKGGEVLPDIEKMIEGLNTGENLIVQQSTTRLSRGDLQVLVF